MLTCLVGLKNIEKACATLEREVGERPDGLGLSHRVKLGILQTQGQRSGKDLAYILKCGCCVEKRRCRARVGTGTAVRIPTVI